MDTQIAEKVEAFFSNFKHIEYKKGEIVIRADDEPSGIYFVKDGYIREYAISSKGDELVINIFKPYSFFPMNSAINNTPNKYFFEAMTKANLWRAPKEKVLTFLKSEPDILLDLLSRVYRGTEGLFMRMTYLMGGSAYARLIIELAIHAKRFGKKNPASPSTTLNISERELAAQIGMTRETVSREMKRLKEKNILIFHKNILTIHSLAKLEDEIDSGV